MKLNFLLTCNSINQTQTGLDIQGVFDSIGSKDFPAIHPSMLIVANLEVKEEEQNKSYLESFKILFEDKVILEDQTTFESKGPRHQFVHKIEKIVLEKPGRYDIQILIGEKIIGESYFTARQISVDTPPQIR